MDNFDLKKYLAEGKLLKEEQYSSERINQVMYSPDVINHNFDTIDVIILITDINILR
jgi:hypothetical protein